MTHLYNRLEFTKSIVGATRITEEPNKSIGKEQEVTK